MAGSLASAHTAAAVSAIADHGDEQGVAAFQVQCHQCGGDDEAHQQCHRIGQSPFSLNGNRNPSPESPRWIGRSR